jgi:hypothetical protein
MNVTHTNKKKKVYKHLTFNPKWLRHCNHRDDSIWDNTLVTESIWSTLDWRKRTKQLWSVSSLRTKHMHSSNYFSLSMFHRIHKTSRSKTPLERWYYWKKKLLDTIIKLSLKIRSRYLILRLLGSGIKIIRKSMICESLSKRLVV